MIETRVAEEIALRLRRRAIYSMLSVVLTSMEIACSTASAIAIVVGSYDVSAAFSMAVTSLVAVDTALRIKERAAWHHTAYLQLRNINAALIREKTHRTAHPLQQDLDDILADTPIDILASAFEVCCAPPLPLLARDVKAQRA